MIIAICFHLHYDRSNKMRSSLQEDSVVRIGITDDEVHIDYAIRAMVLVIPILTVLSAVAILVCCYI